MDRLSLAKIPLYWIPLMLSPLAYPLGMAIVMHRSAKRRGDEDMRRWANKLAIILLGIAVTAVACYIGFYFLIQWRTGGSS